jgi:hypothetical protein
MREASIDTSLVTLCGLGLPVPHRDAAELPCCPMCALLQLASLLLQRGNSTLVADLNKVSGRAPLPVLGQRCAWFR